jgi:hypothetical protein
VLERLSKKLPEAFASARRTHDLRLVPEEFRAPIVGPAVGGLLVAGRKELLSAPQVLGGRVGQVCFRARDLNPDHSTKWRIAIS